MGIRKYIGMIYYRNMSRSHEMLARIESGLYDRLNPVVVLREPPRYRVGEYQIA